MNTRATAGTLLGLSLLLAAGAYLLRGRGDAERGAIGAAGSSEPEVARVDAALEATAGDATRSAAAPSPAALPVAEGTAAEREPPAEPAPEPELAEPDLDARSPLALRVVDRAGVGVAEAEVGIRGMRSATDPGSWYSYRGDGPAGRTDADGRVTLEHWDWVNRDGRTSAVDVSVLHPEFAPFRDASFEIGPADGGEREIVLTRGSTVVVSAWIGSPSARVAPIAVQVDRGARLGADAWIENQDGSLQTSRLEPGEHLLRVRYDGAEHGTCFSELEAFTLGENDWKALNVELFPVERFVGELDPSVPRPIPSGSRVQICVRAGGRGLGPSLSREFEAEVAADGTFTIEGIPRGEAQLIALTHGWVSRRMRPTTLDDAGISIGGEPTADRVREALERVEPDRFIPQVVRVPQTARPYVVAMEPTGSVEFRVVTAAGEPIEGVGAALSPNVCYVNVGCGMFPWREWSAQTDADGRCRIGDVPPGEHFASARGQGWRMAKVDGDRWLRPDVRSGETTTLEVVLERDE